MGHSSCCCIYATEMNLKALKCGYILLVFKLCGTQTDSAQHWSVTHWSDKALLLHYYYYVQIYSTYIYFCGRINHHWEECFFVCLCVVVFFIFLYYFFSSVFVLCECLHVILTSHNSLSFSLLECAICLDQPNIHTGKYTFLSVAFIQLCVCVRACMHACMPVRPEASC